MTAIIGITVIEQHALPAILHVRSSGSQMLIVVESVGAIQYGYLNHNLFQEKSLEQIL